MTTISIALATYNGERFLVEQLQSLVHQTRLPDELVVSDDGSTDSTLSLLEEFAKTAPFPVRIEPNRSRLGFQRNFLRCAELCHGDYISFCDQDDIWLPQKIERILNRIDSTHPDLVYHNATVFDQNGDIGPLYSGVPQSVAPKGTAFFMFSPWGFTATFNRRLLRFNRLHAGSRDPYKFGHLEAHDQWVHFLATLSGMIEYVPEQLAKYRQHEGNLVGTPHKRRTLSLVHNLAASSQRQVALWDCSRRRLRILAQIDGDASPSFARLDDMTELYDETVRILTARKDIYTARAMVDRIQALLKLIRVGAYATDGARRTFGSKGLAKDLLIGIFSAPMLRRQK